MSDVKKPDNRIRDVLSDMVRGLAVILVVWGHCIQEGNGAAFSSGMLYFDDRLYQFIYSFHMPLFALVAGYYAYVSVKRVSDNSDRNLLLIRRVVTLIIPIVFWTLFEFIRNAILLSRAGVPSDPPAKLIISLCLAIITNHWFLWAMIICFVIVWFVHFILNDSVPVYIALFIISLFLPDGMNMQAYKFLLPYYVIAFYYARYRLGRADSGAERKTDKIFDLYEQKKLLSTALFIIVFAVLFIFYNRDSFVYVSGYRITKGIWYVQLIRDIYRFIIGMTGSICVISICDLIRRYIKGYSFPVLTLFGRYSLGVYIISGYLILLVLRMYTDPLAPDDIRAGLETFIIAAVSVALSFAIAKVPVLKKIIGK